MVLAGRDLGIEQHVLHEASGFSRFDETPGSQPASEPKPLVQLRLRFARPRIAGGL